MPAQCTETSECTLADVLSAIEDIEEMMEHNYVYVRPPPPPPLRWFVTACAVGGCYTHRPSRGVPMGLTPRRRGNARVICTGQGRQ